MADYERKVSAVNRFHPSAKPTNAGRLGLDDIREKLPEERAKIINNVEDIMDLHRSLLRGNGFYSWMTKRIDSAGERSIGMDGLQMESTASIQLRPLPVVNFLNFNDDKHADAIVEEALPEDRARFRQYLSKRHLGLGLITAVSLSFFLSLSL